MAELRIPPMPLRFRPVYKDYIWGGDRIVHKYGRPEPPGIYAESWEVADRSEGMSVVADGPLASRTLSELRSADPAGLLGVHARPGPFPLLVKLIDARERLSVQVHPDEVCAARHGGEPKTEAWYVLEAELDACVFAGLRPGVDRAAVEDAIRRTRLEEVLNRVPVAAGDAIFVPGGRVHALDAGLVILEVQQNSNTTYRMYDWGRVGHDGRPRETHVAQALRCVRWTDTSSPRCTPETLPSPPHSQRQRMIGCSAFVMERWRIGAAVEDQPPAPAMRMWFICDGELLIEGGDQHVRIDAGVTVLLPAAFSSARLVPTQGPVEAIRLSLP